jgi:hypothetical protein
VPIQRTDEQIIAEGPGLLGRLGRHLTAVEKGEEGAGDDLAAVLRILIDPKDKGNRAMMRLAKATKLSLPDVLVSGWPEAKPDKALLLSFGNLPLVPAPGDGQPHAPHIMGFREWIEATSLIVPSSQHRSESWGSFATLAGNTSGAHLSTEYHDLLVTSDLFGSVGLSLQDYLLRQVGWQVERVLADLLTRAGKPIIPRTRPLDYWPRLLVWGWFKDSPGIGTEMMIAVNVTSDDGPPVEVMKYKRRDRMHHVWHAGRQVQIKIDDPEA